MKTFKLENQPKIETGFKTPDHYFENFSANIIQQIKEEPVTKKSNVISIFRKRKNTLMAVAAVLVFGLMIPAFYQNSTKNTEIDLNTLENYLAEETPINQYELIEDIETKKLIANENSLEKETLEDLLITNSNLENLIIEN
ncbi:hypothetical protein [Flavobacterium sp. IMCC34518]|uniref:hypothetical protein n=1 Tax=Flavobacterium sp. IMCC34518 TaxID=3003623 RepID=UPI0022AC0C0E|nr:hypothetical protein [Flavobacterium sp. IMCC34518]